MKRDDANGDLGSNEPYEINLEKMLKESNMDRPAKEIAKENIELKQQICTLQDRI
jgi:myosin heavy subunit